MHFADYEDSISNNILILKGISPREVADRGAAPDMARELEDESRRRRDAEEVLERSAKRYCGASRGGPGQSRYAVED